MPPVAADPPERPEGEDEDLGILCPNCAGGNVPDADFCARCRAPLSMLATIDPLKQTFAEGFAYRQAVDGTAKPIVLIGIWLIFFPTTALSLWKAVSDGHRDSLEFAGIILSALFSAVILYRTTAGFLRKRRERRDILPED